MRLNIFSIASSDATPEARLASEARDWLILLTSGRATVADARALRQWCGQSAEHARAFEQAKALWHGLQPAAQALQVPRRFGRRAFLGGAMAASAAFLLIRATVPGGVSGLGADYITEVGEQRRVELGEGISLELNTQTRLSRRPLTEGGQALELLGGEIEVSGRSASTISIQAGTGWISAARARFNIRYVDRSVCATCLEGVVQVRVQGRSFRLEPGMQMTYDNVRAGSPQNADVSAAIAWREQVLVFNDATLSSVIDEINRYRPGMLLLLNPQLGRRKVQARFRLDQLAGVALLIRDAYGAKCIELPGGVVVLS